MTHSGEVPRVPLQQASGCLIASLQIELSGAVLGQFRTDLLEQVRSVQPAGVVLDVSGLPLFDRHEFDSLKRTMDMVNLMGYPTILVGMQPGMAAAIAEADDQCDNLVTVRSLEEAFFLVGGRRRCPGQSTAS